MTDEITEILNFYHAADLSSMANEAGIVALTTRGRPKKDDVAVIMRQRFFTPQRVQASYAKLDGKEKEVFNRILLHTQPTPKSQLRRELVKATLVTEAPQPAESSRYYSRSSEYEGSFTRKTSTIFEDVIARLTWHGLVFTKAKDAYSQGYAYKQRISPGEILYVPRFVRAALPAPIPIPIVTNLRQPEEIQPADPNRLLRELYLYWDYARRGGINLLNSGSVGKREFKVLNGLMLVPDPAIETARKEEEMVHLHFLRTLLQSAGLLHAVAGQLRPKEKDPLKIPDFWHRPVEEQLLVCLRHWETASSGAETVEPDESDTPLIKNARNRLLHMLAALGESEWVSVQEMLENFWETELDFLYRIHAQTEESNRWYGGTFQGNYFYGEKGKLIQAIQASERLFLQKCLDEPLTLLGLVDRGQYTNRQGKPTNLYRLNERGRRVVAAHLSKSATAVAADTAPTADSGRILLQPNFHLVAMGPVPLAVLARLDLFAKRLQVGVGAFEYELTRESVYQAHQIGMEADQIRAHLVELCGGALPQNVDRTLSEWAQHQERIVFRSGVDLLQANDPALLEKLAGLAPVADQIERTLTPSLVLLKERSIDKITAALKEAAQLPIVTDALPAATNKSIRLDDDGTIHLLHPLPSLFLEGRLSKIAELSKKGQWKLSHSTVQQAGGNRTKINDLLAELASLSQSPLAAPLVDRIKAWGGYYGSAGMAQITLMEFQSRDVLDELLKMADLRLRLRSLNDKQPLAIVTEKDLAPVKKTLECLGISIKNGVSHV